MCRINKITISDNQESFRVIKNIANIREEILKIQLEKSTSKVSSMKSLLYIISIGFIIILAVLFSRRRKIKR